MENRNYVLQIYAEDSFGNKDSKVVDIQLVSGGLEEFTIGFVGSLGSIKLEEKDINTANEGYVRK